VIAETADRVAVMYTGQIMESADTLSLFSTPLHPYTRGLMQAIPSLAAGAGQGELYEIAGVVPSLLDLPTGCPFNPRCPQVEAICCQEKPDLREVADGHQVACWMVGHD
jgi:oligopeptide/dipeptide ABC transporter ATP-binding protein